MHLTVQQYATSVRKSRFTIYRWMEKRKNGNKLRKNGKKKVGLPNNVKIVEVAGHEYLKVSGKKEINLN